MQKNEYLITLMREFVKLKEKLKVVERKLWESNHSTIQSILIGNSERKVDAVKEFSFLIKTLENDYKNINNIPEDIQIDVNSFQKQLEEHLKLVKLML